MKIGHNPGHFMNCQDVCDRNLKFVDAEVKWPGSLNDTSIRNNSGFKSRKG